MPGRKKTQHNSSSQDGTSSQRETRAKLEIHTIRVIFGSNDFFFRFFHSANISSRVSHSFEFVYEYLHKSRIKVKVWIESNVESEKRATAAAARLFYTQNLYFIFRGSGIIKSQMSWVSGSTSRVLALSMMCVRDVAFDLCKQTERYVHMGFHIANIVIKARANETELLRN